MRLFQAAGVLALLSIYGFSALAWGQKKKKGTEEEWTQTREVLPDPPAVLAVETARLGFITPPLTAKGLLSQQVRDSLKWMLSAAKGASIVKIRGFVAGTGDMRRVQSIVSEVFSDKRLVLPVISVVQVGGLPMEGAQVQLEAWTQDKRVINPNGLAFLSGQQAVSPELTQKMRPLAQQSVANLQTALSGLSLGPEDVTRVTCFLTSLDDIADVRGVVSAVFPRSPVAYLQSQRSPMQSLVECEAVARLRKAPPEPVQLLNPAGLTASPNYSQVAIVHTPKLVLSGSQLAFRYTEADARLAFQRLEKTLQGSGTSLRHVVLMNTYPLSNKLVDMVRRVRFDFLEKTRPPASTMLPFEGLPSMDGAFALEAVAIPQ